MSPRSKKKFLTITSIAFLLIGIYILKSCQAQNNKKILIATSLTGPNAKIGTNIVQAIQLFLKLHHLENWRLVTMDSQSNDRLNAEQTFQLYQKASSHSILFGPRGTKASLEFIKLCSQQISPQNNRFIFLNQVTASPIFNHYFNSLSTFISSQNYLAGVLYLLKKKVGTPGRIHILRLKDIPYFEDMVMALKKEMKKLDLNQGKEIFFSLQDDRASLNDFLSKNVQENDWLVILDYGPQHYISHQMNPVFSKALKIFVYGQMPSNQISSQEKETFLNSLQVLTWLPHLDYSSQGTINNCHFSKKFEEAFAHPPDFHAAYIFSTLEADETLRNSTPSPQNRMKQIEQREVKTIVGTVRWDKEGTRINGFPALLLIDRNGQKTLYEHDQNTLQWCSDENADTSIPILPIPK